MAKIKKCPKCEQYTIKSTCPKCKVDTENPEPAKFNPSDKYGEYRRRARKDGNLR